MSHQMSANRKCVSSEETSGGAYTICGTFYVNEVMSSIINGFIVFALIINFTYFVGLLTFLNSYEENKCDMTFMFEYPQFVKIFNEVDHVYSKYALYAYSEGRLTEKARDMSFDGIPVLFIPGNGGSHRQVRSLASIALRKAYNSRMPFHFDYFSVDLNSELSGLNGALLADQLNYVNSSIYRVLDLYKNNRNPPKSIILFGHSMGGVIARRLILNLSENSDLVPIVLTLASPHKRPPLMLDSYSYNFYKAIESNGSKQFKTFFVSLNGGYSDFLVPSFVTELPNDNSLNVATTHIPRSWLPADHLCILWCKQTILVINRAFFDSVDPKTKQISTNISYIKSVFHHHLIRHSGINSRLKDSYDYKANVRNQGEWVEPFGRQYSIQFLQGIKIPHFVMVRLINQPQHEALTVIAVNLETVDWAYVCGAHIPRGTQRICEEFTHLTQLSEIAPSAKYKRRILKVSLHEMIKNKPNMTHVVLRMLPTSEPIILHVDVYNLGERKRIVNLPNMFSFKKQKIIEETLDKAIHYELVLPNLQHLIQSYYLYVDSIKCTNQFHHATASLIVPWSNQNQHKFFVDGDSDPFHVRLYQSRPQWASNYSARIQLTLDPNCRYRVSIRSSLPGALSQMARFYSSLLIANVAAVILMTLHSQLKSISKSQSCSLFFEAVKEGAKPYYILTSVKLISRVISVKPFNNFLPSPDWLIMSQEGTDFFLLPLLLYICSVGIVWLLGIILSISLLIFESTIHKFVLKFLARTVSFTISWSDHVMSALHKLPFVVVGALVFLSLTTTGSLALCVGMIFYFMKLTQMSQDYIEELVWYYITKLSERFKKTKTKSDQGENKDVKDKGNNNNNNNTDLESSMTNTIFFHCTLFLLWSLITIINVPSVLTWAHNFKYSTVLQPDPAFLPGIVLSICALPLWQLELPKMKRKWYTEIGHIIAALAVISLIYAPISIFRLNYTLTVAMVIVIIHQLVASDRTDVTIESKDEPFSFYERIKTKLE